MLHCWAAADRSVVETLAGAVPGRVFPPPQAHVKGNPGNPRYKGKHRAMEIPRSSLTELAVINAVLKLRLRAVLGRNISPGRVKGGSESWSLHCWAAAVCPVWEHHLPLWAWLLLAQTDISASWLPAALAHRETLCLFLTTAHFPIHKAF